LNTSDTHRRKPKKERQSIGSVVWQQITRRHVIRTQETASAVPALKPFGSSSRGTLRSRKRYQQMTTVVTYAAILALIASVASVGYQPPVEQEVAARTATTSSVLEADKPSVDQIVAADLAASTAETANLSVASNVANLSISLNAKGELAQSDDNLLSKPQIIQPNAGARGITAYTTVVGDSVPSIAARFGLSPDTIRWANNLSTDAVNPGQQLSIPGTDGVVYTVRGGDTTAGLAQKYRATEGRIVSYNDLEFTGLTPGQRIVIPGGVLPDNERPGRTTTGGGGSSSSFGGRIAAASVGNRYDYGYCTWYAYNRRAQLGRPVGSFWGNASTWASYARASGYRVDNRPAPGAVMQSGGYGGYGHVAVVESVGADGSVTVSEMNYAGWNVVSSRTIPAGQASAYNYIH
jgi:surface antigen